MALARPAAVIAVVSCGIAATGCGYHLGDSAAASGKTPAIEAPAKGFGMVQGRILRPPGPDPRSGSNTSPGPLPGTPVPVNSDPLRAYDARGRIAAASVSGTGGGPGLFQFLLRPGTYRIAENICHISRTIQVGEGTTTLVTLNIPNAC